MFQFPNINCINVNCNDWRAIWSDAQLLRCKYSYRVVEAKCYPWNSRSLISDFNLLDCYNRKTTVRGPAWLVHSGEGRGEIARADRSADSRTRLSTSRNPSISLRGFFPAQLLTCDRKPATSMALLTRGLELLGQPKAPPLSKESTWWLDQCRCWKF